MGRSQARVRGVYGMDGERMTAGAKPEWQQPSENRDGVGAVDLQGVMQGRS